jgi:LysM repeat protein
MVSLAVYSPSTGQQVEKQMVVKEPTTTVAESNSQLPLEDLPHPVDINTHQVTSGETISEIADHYNLRVETIFWANGITADTPIQPGQELAILPLDGLVYLTKEGDSISAIATRFQVSAPDLIELNDLNNQQISVGQRLVIPYKLAQGSYLIGRGGADDNESQSESESEPEPESQTRGGWLHPSPGSIVTQTTHGQARAVDFGAPVGTAVLASDGGVITKASTGYNGGFGTVIEIDHQDGTWSRYAHLSSLQIASGQTVSAGEVIGYVGNTGRSSGPHLHFEIHGSTNPFASCGYLSRCGA